MSRQCRPRTVLSITLKLSYGDWVLLSDGSLQTVSEAEKCAQDIGESFQNNRDPVNPSWYNGSELYLIDRNPTMYASSGLAAEMMIRKMLEESLLRLKAQQGDDLYCDDAERIDYLKTLRVDRIGSSSYAFYAVAITDTDEPVLQNYAIRLIPTMPSGMAQSVLKAQAAASSGKKTFL